MEEELSNQPAPNTPQSATTKRNASAHASAKHRDHETK